MWWIVLAGLLLGYFIGLIHADLFNAQRSPLPVDLTPTVVPYLLNTGEVRFASRVGDYYEITDEGKPELFRSRNRAMRVATYRARYHLVTREMSETPTAVNMTLVQAQTDLEQYRHDTAALVRELEEGKATERTDQ